MTSPRPMWAWPKRRRARSRAATRQANAATTRAVFEGAQGPDTDLVLLNSGAAIYAAGRTDDLRSGVELARETIASGAAAAALQEYVRISTELAPVLTRPDFVA